jgi:eukaryotic-like serine/threonine-protein kinase
MVSPSSPVGSCPGKQVLEQYLFECLDAAAVSTVEDHLEHCAACQCAVAELSSRGKLNERAPRENWAPAPRFLQKLREAVQGDADETETGAARGAAPAEPLPFIAGYRLLRVLGQGGMGLVYEAVQESLGRHVAVKTLRGDRITADLVERLRREAEAIARLQHPNIVQIFDIGTWKATPSSADLPYLAMEFVGGEPLSRVLTGTPQPAGDAAEFVETLARAVHIAHAAGIVHRDLKPGNILLPRPRAAEESKFRHPKITDFGLAKDIEAGSNLTETGQVLGTPSYMAPEQVRGQSEAIGPAADIYALGALLYEILTGRPPFTGSAPVDILMQLVSVEPVSPRRLVPRLPRDIETICLKCLEKDPGKRYASALALADDLRRFQQHEPIHARPLSVPGRAVKLARRHPAVALLTSALLLVMAGLLGLGTWSYFEISQALMDKGKALEKEEQAVKDKDVALGQKIDALGQVEKAFTLEQALRKQTEAETYRALSSETSLLRTVRPPGWRKKAFGNLERLAQSTTPQRDPVALRSEAMACMDFPDLAEVARIPFACISLDFNSDGKALAGISSNAVGVWEVPTLKAKQFAVTRDAFARQTKGGAIYRSNVVFRPGHPGTLFFGLKHGIGSLDLTKGVPVPMAGIDKKTVETASWQFDFDGSGDLLAVGWMDGQASIFDLKSGERQWTSPPPQSPNAVRYPIPVSLSHDGEYIAVSGLAQGVWAYRWRDSVKPITFSQNRPSATSLKFSPDNRIVAATYPDESVVLWNFRGRRPHRTLQGHTAIVHSLAFHPDGQWLATASADQTVRLWDTWSGQLLQTLKPNAGQISAVRFSRDGKYLAISGIDLILYEVTVKPARQVALMDLPTSANPYTQVQTGALHPAAPTFAAAEGSQLVLLNLDTGREVRRWTHSEWGAKGKFLRSAMTYSPRGDVLAASAAWAIDGNGGIGLWDVARGKLLKTLDAHKDRVYSMAFDHDGKRLVSAGAAEAVLWDTASGAVVHRWPDAMWNQAAFLNKSKEVFLLGADGKYLRSDAGGQTIFEGKLPMEYFRVAFTPDESHIMLACREHVAVLSYPDMKPQTKIAVAQLSAFAYCPRSALIATCGNDRRVKLWEARTGQLIGALPEEDNIVTHLEFARKGSRLVAGGLFPRVVSYDLAAIRSQLERLGLAW